MLFSERKILIFLPSYFLTVLGLRWLSVAGVSIALIALLSLIAYSQLGTTEDAREFQYRYRPLQMGTQIVIDVVAPNGTRLIPRICSLGFPAYYEVPRTADWIVVVYGVVTASHCGYAGNSVYQNVTIYNNYIGYMRDEGKFGVGDELLNRNLLSDSTFIRVESYVYSVGSPRPSPQIVGYYIHMPGNVTVPINGYIRNEQDLWNTYQNQWTLYKSGRTTGVEAGPIILCHNTTQQLVACWDTDWGGFYFLINAYGMGGDSGGPVYMLRYEDGFLRLRVAVVYGITWFIEFTNCITDRLGNWLCRPTGVSILYNITADLRVIPYPGG